jgi:hypothetical protein
LREEIREPSQRQTPLSSPLPSKTLTPAHDVAAAHRRSAAPAGANGKRRSSLSPLSLSPPPRGSDPAARRGRLLDPRALTRFDSLVRAGGQRVRAPVLQRPAPVAGARLPLLPGRQPPRPPRQHQRRHGRRHHHGGKEPPCFSSNLLPSRSPLPTPCGGGGSDLGLRGPDLKKKTVVRGPDLKSETQAINEKILSMDVERAEIKAVDAQESLGGGVTVLVMGHLTRRTGVSREFVQSFFLAPQEKGYFVLNDILRYAGEEGDAAAMQPPAPEVAAEATPVLPNGTAETVSRELGMLH